MVALTYARQSQGGQAGPCACAGGGASGAQVLRLDWRVHPGFAVHLPADVDRQERVR